MKDTQLPVTRWERGKRYGKRNNGKRKFEKQAFFSSTYNKQEEI